MNQITQEAVNLLQELIKHPSFSGEEHLTADTIFRFFLDHGLSPERHGNNIVVNYQAAGNDVPFILLCSHHDTVRPNASYTKDPFMPTIENGRLYGLGSNDAGASLVCLIFTLLELIKNKTEMNIVLAAVAEEEISGANGVSSLLDTLPNIELAIVGEPTGMSMAVAEKGLVVIDGISQGIPGHAAHENVINPIYQASQDIIAIRDYEFDQVSDFLGATKASVTVVHAGQQHNQVPAQCQFVIDVRVNEKYGLEEVVDRLQSVVKSKLSPRSLRLRSSGIAMDHRIFSVAQNLGISTFGSATLSDQALLPYPSIKIGPGDTLRSHSADEYIYISEIENGIKKYLQLIKEYSK